jgi:hypothetical protein
MKIKMNSLNKNDDLMLSKTKIIMTQISKISFYSMTLTLDFRFRNLNDLVSIIENFVVTTINEIFPKKSQIKYSIMLIVNECSS